MKIESPAKFRLEAASVCQLRCPLCPTTHGQVKDGAAGSGFLTLEDFKRFVAQNPAAQTIELSNYGEIFLNPDLPSILEYAYQQRIKITMINGVNLNRASDEMLEALVKYRVRVITVSLDGATQETYEKYRVRGNLETVLENIRKINAYRRQYRAVVPMLVWQFVIFGHNEHELNMAHQMAKDLNMFFLPKANWDPDYSPLKEQSDAHAVPANATIPAEAILFAPKQTPEGLPDQSESPCWQLWENPQVNWDAKILGCCVNYWDDFGGNAFEQPTDEWLNSPKLVKARNMLQGKSKATQDDPCMHCDIYHDMVKTNNFLKVSD